MMEIRFLKKKSLFTKNIEKMCLLKKKVPPPARRGRGSLTLNFGNEKNVIKHLYKYTKTELTHC